MGKKDYNQKFEGDHCGGHMEQSEEVAKVTESFQKATNTFLLFINIILSHSTGCLRTK